MNPDHFVKVFDVLDSGFKDWQFSAFGLIFVAIGLLIFLFPGLIKLTGIPFLKFKSRWQTFFRYYPLIFAILWTLVSFAGTYSAYLHHKALAQNNSCRTIEGPVENFVPMPPSGHPEESFSVSGVQFHYSEFIATDAFNDTSSYGGPIDKDSYVRICYDPAGNAILRLEIRDFKGEAKDYSKETMFPGLNNRQIVKDNNIVPPKPPWYANLFMFLWIADFIATLSLFAPYLNTFFRIARTPIKDRAIPDTLEPGKMTKLRNTIAYWDRPNRAIWLRPRGLNLLQVQQSVAKLNIDEYSRSITEQEIRFSSGFPIVMAVFLWTAYEFFSTTMPTNGNGPSAGQFVGFAALVFAVGGFFVLRRLRSRMDALIQDALSEFRDMSRLPP